MGAPEPKRQSWCRACETLASLDVMQPVGNGPADLDTMLSDRWLCVDEAACLKRYTARNRGDKVIFEVILPSSPGSWGGGTVLLHTDNPRLAEQHAHAYSACVVPKRIRSDYRKA